MSEHLELAVRIVARELISVRAPEDLADFELVADLQQKRGSIAGSNEAGIGFGADALYGTIIAIALPIVGEAVRSLIVKLSQHLVQASTKKIEDWISEKLSNLDSGKTSGVGSYMTSSLSREQISKIIDVVTEEAQTKGLASEDSVALGVILRQRLT
jgi:hypothetical protein